MPLFVLTAIELSCDVCGNKALRTGRTVELAVHLAEIDGWVVSGDFPEPCTGVWCPEHDPRKR